MEIAKSMIMKLLSEHIQLNRDIFIEFFLQYPGICRDFIYDKPITAVDRNVAPCIVKELYVDNNCQSLMNIFYCGNSNKYMVISNVYWQKNYTGDTIFGKYISESIRCPDGKIGCFVDHRKIKIKLDKKHIILRRKFNSVEWKYNELLPLWQKFYDNKMNKIINEIYEKHFLGDVTNKILYQIRNNGHNPNRIKTYILNEIKHI